MCARAPAVLSPCAFCRGRSVLAQQGTGCRSCLALVLFSYLFPFLPFHEVKSNMETNSQVTEGSLALDDAFADLEGSTHCSFPCPCPLMLPLAERGAASRGNFRGSWRCFKALREKLSSLYSNSKTKQLCSTGGAFKADCKPRNQDET